jgi:acyl carrier protein
VTVREEVAGVVLEALEAVSRRRLGPLSELDDVLLGKQGLGLDSIDVVEVLIRCEDRYGQPIGPLLERGVPITFGSVVDHFAR